MRIRRPGTWHPLLPRRCTAAPARARATLRCAHAIAGIIIWAVCRTALPANAQNSGSGQPLDLAPESFVHESWTVQDGLPVNSINALLQNREGYIWIATFDGLVRFDGVRFTVFNSANSPGLPSNRITDLIETRDGTLWMRTEQQQLVRFRDGEFTHFGAERGLAEAARVLYEDTRGRVLVATDRGLGDIQGERFIPVAAGAIHGAVQAVLQRADGSLWAGVAGDGLMRIEGDLATTIVSRSALGSADITSLYEDARGTLWIATSESTWRYRDVPERVLPFPALGFRPAPRTGELWFLTSNQVLRLGAQDPVIVVSHPDAVHRPQRLIPDADGQMLYSSGAELHRAGRRLFTVPGAAGRPGEPQAITAILPDREGSLWLGTFGAGLHRLKPALFTVYGEPEGISRRNVYSLYEDRAGALWIGTLWGGTYRLANGRITQLAEAAGYPQTVLSILQDRRGRLWLGGSEGLRVCTPPGGSCVAAPGDPVGPEGVHALHEAADGAIWIGTLAGLYRYEDEGRWTRLDPAGGAPSFLVRAFLRTRDGALWMGTNGGGLARYQQGRFTRVTMAEGLPLDLIRSLHEDDDGWLWVGTEGRGLARLDPREWTEDHRGRIVSYGLQDGLFDEVIHQILEDDFGRLWMSTNRGIFRVDRGELLAFAEGRVPRINSTGYTERDGLRNREANGGSQPAGIESSDGRLWFPTQDGVAVVDPARVQQNRLSPSVVIEQVNAGGAGLRPVRGALDLGVEQRDLEIEYTALSFLAPANVRFRYRLEPYDREWVDAGGRRTAYYTRVPPGRYTFRVIASNNDGVWNEEGAALALSLAPYFWETGAFRLLGLLALVFLLAGGFGWRVRSLRLRTRELARLVDERTTELRAQQRQLEAQAGQLQALDRAKSHFFANVSHEFRTPLTLILGPLRDVTEKPRGSLPAWLREQHEMMLRNAQRLLRLVNQVLDLAKLESGSLNLVTDAHDLVALARASAHSFTPLAERRGIALRFDAPMDPLPVQVDAEQMEKVLLNLISNAFKFTEAGGEVVVALSRAQGEAVIAVQDTGIGIPADQLPHVFERFYQADSSATRRHEGTGIGLSLVRELVELHGGSVAARSQEGHGSTFTVTLPLRPYPAEPSTAAPGQGEDNGGGVLPSPLVAEPPVEGGRGDSEAEDRTTVLVVDDNADVRAYVRSVLEPGYRVLEAVDGQDGLERAREALPDLVVSDVMMPRLDGFSLTRALREEPATDCIPIILLTARVGEQAEIEGLGTGADDYLAKPFHAGVLEARVTALIANRRRLRERFRLEGLPPAVAPVPAPRHSELEARLRTLVETSLTDPDFNAEALARAAGLSYQQLHRRIARELGATPSQFLRTVRVERAAVLLREGTGSITEIAYSVGFNSLSYFHRCFHERFGIAPSELPKLPA